MIGVALSVVALVLILALSRVGAIYGAFAELTNLLLAVIAAAVSLRYWYLITGCLLTMTPLPATYATVIAFWAPFLVVSLTLLFLARLIREEAQPRYPHRLDAALGFVFSLGSGAIFVCAILMSLSVAAPAFWSKYNRAELLLPFDRAPIVAYQFVEQRLAGLAADDPARTRLPSLEKDDANDFFRYWR
jgi:uncharacterized membrane protein required for colicin V production